MTAWTASRVIGSAHADSLTGDGNANHLVGGGGDTLDGGGDAGDALEGGGGDDHLVGHGAGDTLNSGAHDHGDTVDYSGHAGAVTVNLTAGTGPGGDIVRNIENVIGGGAADSLTGQNGVANILRRQRGRHHGGMGAHDTLYSGDGGDRLVANEAGDVLRRRQRRPLCAWRRGHRRQCP